MRCIIDMDEVLALTVEEWVRIYNIRHDDNLQMSTIDSWFVDKFVKPLVVDEFGVESGCGKRVYELLNEKGFFASLKPVPGAIKGMKQLIDSGHDVIIATATPMESEHAFEEKVAWIKKHMPFFNINNFVSIHRKDMLKGDIMFDDALHNLKGFGGVTVAMRRPWNYRPWNYSPTDYHYSVDTWSEFLNIVDDLDLMHTYNKASINVQNDAHNNAYDVTK